MTPQEIATLLHLKSEYNALLWRISMRLKKSPEEIEKALQQATQKSIQKMQVRFTTYIDPYHFALNVSPKHQKEFLIELFKIFYSEHVIEAYKEVQQHNPDLFPPLLEEQ